MMTDTQKIPAGPEPIVNHLWVNGHVVTRSFSSPEELTKGMDNLNINNPIDVTRFPQVARNVQAMRERTLGSKEAEKEERNAIEQLVEGNERLVKLLGTTYDKMIADTAKQGGKPTGLEIGKDRIMNRGEYIRWMGTAVVRMSMIRSELYEPDDAPITPDRTNMSVGLMLRTAIYNPGAAERTRNAADAAQPLFDGAINRAFSEFRVDSGDSISSGRLLHISTTNKPSRENSFMEDFAVMTARCLTPSKRSHNTRVTYGVIQNLLKTPYDTNPDPAIRIAEDKELKDRLDALARDSALPETGKHDKKDAPKPPPVPPETDKNPKVAEAAPKVEAKGTKKKSKIDSVIDIASELLLGAEVITASYLATAAIDRAMKARNEKGATPEAVRTETKRERLLRFGVSNGLFVAMPVAALIAYNKVKKEAGKSEKGDRIRSNVLRAVSSGGILYAAGYAINAFRNRGTAAPEPVVNEAVTGTDIPPVTPAADRVAHEEQVKTDVKFGLADYIAQIREQMKAYGFADLEVTDAMREKPGVARLLILDEKARAVQQGSGEKDEIITLVAQGITYSGKVLTKLGVMEDKNVQEAFNVIEDVVRRAGTSAETAEALGRGVHNILSAIMQFSNDDLSLGQKFAHVGFRIVNMASEPTPRAPKDPLEEVRMNIGVIEKLRDAGSMTTEDAEKVLVGLREKLNAVPVEVPADILDAAAKLQHLGLLGEAVAKYQVGDFKSLEEIETHLGAKLTKEEFDVIAPILGGGYVWSNEKGTWEAKAA